MLEDDHGLRWWLRVDASRGSFAPKEGRVGIDRDGFDGATLCERNERLSARAVGTRPVSRSTYLGRLLDVDLGLALVEDDSSGFPMACLGLVACLNGLERAPRGSDPFDENAARVMALTRGSVPSRRAAGLTFRRQSEVSQREMTSLMFSKAFIGRSTWRATIRARKGKSVSK